MDLSAITDLLTRVGEEALLPRLERVAAQTKADGSLLSEADLAVDRAIRLGLERLYPSIALLSEEMTSAEQTALLDSGRPVWCLDPLDGTTNFLANFPLFSLSLALIEDGQVTLGVIRDPVRAETFAAQKGQGAFLNGRRLQRRLTSLPMDQWVALVDFKRLPSGLAARLATRPPYASQRNLGTCALEWAWLAAGRGHAYLHGGMRLWDYAAGSLLLEEVGGVCATLEEEPIFRSDPGPRSVVAATDATAYRAWQDALKKLSSEERA